MARWRAVLGLVTGAFLALSGVAHTLLGGKAMREEMAKAAVPADLAAGLNAGWVWGGVAMFAFAAIVVGGFLQGLKGRAIPLAPIRWISAAYIVFGVWAIATTSELFFLIFLIPGVLLAVASAGTHDRT